MTELSLGPAAAFSVFVIAVVLAVTAAIDRALEHLRASWGETSVSGLAAG
jgi:hypothetical protein